MNLPFADETSLSRPPGEPHSQSVQLCLGIDPNTGPGSATLHDFKQALAAHSAFLRTLTSSLPSLKPNLGFFLRHGSHGIALLEEFVQEFSPRHHIILDGKFGEIGNTLEAYLDFAFKTLKAHALTVNPFLGERTLELAFEKCAKYGGPRGRIYVLCATSEAGTAELQFIAKGWEKIAEACVAARARVFGNQAEYALTAGVVIGANREEALFSEHLRASRLSVLAPGLGAQKASQGVVAAAFSQPENEYVFPTSRGMFEGGLLSIDEMQARYASLQEIFLQKEI